MTRLGGSRALSDKWTYVQSDPPADRRDGVQWINTSDNNKAYHFSSDHDDWVRQNRVWAQDTQPGPRVGPLDGDQWIDTSDNARPTFIYSVDAADWIEATDVSWGDVTDRPTSVYSTEQGGGYVEGAQQSGSGVIDPDNNNPEDTAHITFNASEEDSVWGVSDGLLGDFEVEYRDDQYDMEWWRVEYIDVDLVDGGTVTVESGTSTMHPSETYSSSYNFEYGADTVSVGITGYYEGSMSYDCWADLTPHTTPLPNHDHSIPM